MKLHNRYRDTVSLIMNRDWMDNRDKYWIVDGLVAMAVRDRDIAMKDLRILQRVRGKYGPRSWN
jgi:hypothetical protein